MEEAEMQLAEITETLDIRVKTEIISRVIDVARANAQKLISNKICVEANRKIESLMPDNLIRIDRIDRCLRLQGQEGGSVGEQLAIAYAFLATLFSSSNHTLPFIVDSPANPIDLEVRKRVAVLIPNLTSQFIAFTISSERQGFLQPLESSTDNPIQYATLFRKGNLALEARARQNTSCIETEDGILVNDRDFFCELQLDKEDGGNDVISN
jgi:DNA sulfur modification protein DndD